MSLSADEVLEQSAAWIWVPEDARTIDTGEAFVIAYPEHFAEPTVALRFESERAADGLIDDVLDAARELGRDVVSFFEISDSTLPPDLEPRLQERGAALVERLAVLALDLSGGERDLPDLDVPGDIEVRPVATLEDMRAVDRIDTASFGGIPQDDDALAASLEREGAEGRILAWRAGEALGSAGSVLAQQTVRLWGGACLPEARHTGVYRALLDHRLRAGVAAGATMALVKGRVETSAPVLLRAGFQQYGEVRAYRLGRSLPA